MKTTIDIDDRLLERARRQAAARGITLRAVIEDALRARFAARPATAARFQFAPPVVYGSRPPAVDPADRTTLYDLLDERE